MQAEAASGAAAAVAVEAASEAAAAVVAEAEDSGAAAVVAEAADSVPARVQAAADFPRGGHRVQGVQAVPSGGAARRVRSAGVQAEAAPGQWAEAAADTGPRVTIRITISIITIITARRAIIIITDRFTDRTDTTGSVAAGCRAAA